MGQKGHIMDQKGLKMHEKRQKIEFSNLKYLLFSGIFLSGIGGYPPPPLNGQSLVGSQAKPTDTPIGTPAPTSPQRPIKAEEHYLRRQLSQSHRAQRRITDDLSLLMAEGDKFWYGLKCCTTIIVTILTAILLLVILRWVLYK